MQCPKCKDGKLYLIEWGTYSGSRQLDDMGNVIPDTYFEDGNDCDGVGLQCSNYECGYYDPSIVVVDEKIKFLYYSPMYDDVGEDQRFQY